MKNRSDLQPKNLRRVIYRTLVGAAKLPLRIGFPGRWKFIAAFINHPRFSQYWSNEPLRWIRGKVHGYWIPCDLTVFSGRSAYFMRRWYEADTQSVLTTLLKPGDTFLDIGANVGMASLAGAKAVGSFGRVIAFEPNPHVTAILAESVARNCLSNITVHCAAFGRRAGRLPLFIPANNHGEASLGTDFGNRAGETVVVDLVGPESLTGVCRCDMIKIDVEGFEVEVLDGLRDVIQRFRPFVVTEVAPHHLARCGSSVDGLFERFVELDYAGFAYREAQLGSFKLQAVLKRVRRPAELDGPNMLWVPVDKVGAIVSTNFLGVSR